MDFYCRGFGPRTKYADGLKLDLDVVQEQAGLWSCADLYLGYTGYLYNQTVTRTAAIVRDIEECFHTGVREVL